MLRGRGVAAALVLLLLLPLPVRGWDDGAHPAQPITLVVGSSDEMKSRNILAPIALGDPHTMAVLARVYDTPVQRDATTGTVVPRLAVGIDGDGDSRLDLDEVGDFSYPMGATVLTVFYDFGAARFHDGVSVSVWDVLFSYHVLALHPLENGPLRILMHLAGQAGSNFTASRWLTVLPADDGDGNGNTSALRFTRQFAFSYLNFATLTLGIPVLPMHVWSRTGSGRHASDFGCAVWIPPMEAAAKGIPECGNVDSSRWGVGVSPGEVVPGSQPFDLMRAMLWYPLNADVIGSGHFRFDYWVPGVEAQLIANEDYAFGQPKVDGVRFLVYKTTQLMVFALQAGQIDLILGSVNAEFHPDLRGTPGIALLEVEDMYPSALSFNLRTDPFGYGSFPPANRLSDRGHVLRHAIAHLVDRPAVVANLLQGHGRVADSMVSPANGPWHNASVPSYPFDLATANSFLDSPEAQSWGIGSDPPGPCDKDNDGGCRPLPVLGQMEFEVLTPQADYDPVLASTGAMIADAMRQVGLNGVSRPTAWGQILTATSARAFHLFLTRSPDHRAIDPWSLLRGDPDYLFDSFHASNAAEGRNLAGFYDVAFDGAVAASRLEWDVVPRDFHVRTAQGILAERLPVIPVAYANWTWAYRIDRFIGWELVGGTVFNYWTLQGLDSAPAPNPAPTVSLLSPTNGSVIPPGRVIDLDVADTDLGSVVYSLDGAPSQTLAAPWDVSTTTWADGDRELQVVATDMSGGSTIASFDFTLDSLPPVIRLVTPDNESLIGARRRIDFEVEDSHLAAVTVRADGEAFRPFPAPYDVVLEDLLPQGIEPDQGPHTIRVEAVDAVGNIATAFATLTLDSIAPTVLEGTPTGTTSADPVVRARFSEPVNRTSVEAAFSISDGTRTWTAAEGTFAWEADGQAFVFVPAWTPAMDRRHEVRLAASLTDLAGNPLGADAVWLFTPGGVGAPPFVVSMVLLAGALLVAALLAYRRRKRASPPE